VIEAWQAWGSAAAVGVAIAAAIVARVLLPGALERLPIAHVAAAAIIGVLAWEAAIQLPGNLISFLSIGAGLGGFIVTPLQVYVVAASLSTIAMFVAVVAILRRQIWGVALGVGVGLVQVAMSAVGVVSLLGMTAQGMPEDQLLWLLVSVGLRAVPGIVAVALLLRPLRRPVGPVAVVDGITDVDADLTIEDASELVAGQS
jgi:hypothetical protein